MSFNYQKVSTLLQQGKSLDERPLLHLLNALRSTVDETERHRLQINKLSNECGNLRRELVEAIDHIKELEEEKSND